MWRTPFATGRGCRSRRILPAPLLLGHQLEADQLGQAFFGFTHCRRANLALAVCDHCAIGVFRAAGRCDVGDLSITYDSVYAPEYLSQFRRNRGKGFKQGDGFSRRANKRGAADNRRVIDEDTRCGTNSMPTSTVCASRGSRSGDSTGPIKCSAVLRGRRI